METKIRTKFELTSKGDWDKFCKWRVKVKWLLLNRWGMWTKTSQPNLSGWKYHFITPAGNAVEVIHPDFEKS